MLAPNTLSDRRPTRLLTHLSVLRYLHFEVCPPPPSLPSSLPAVIPAPLPPPTGALIPREPDPLPTAATEKEGSWPASWISCDVRKFDLDVLGTFDVIMADPPWVSSAHVQTREVGDPELTRHVPPALLSGHPHERKHGLLAVAPGPCRRLTLRRPLVADRAATVRHDDRCRPCSFKAGALSDHD